ncbi:MAG: hypothetical protein BZY72_01905 [SAR202 cluster bacterium Io17-Chloro-G8]|nr:MAG: hypothetical protein BZY72_01905 [SAR202 cluster bacterium Io17-Chloro-G8]
MARAVELCGFVQRSCQPTAVSHWGLALCAPSPVIPVLPRKERNLVAMGTIAVRRQRDPSPSLEMGGQASQASVKSFQPHLRKGVFGEPEIQLSLIADFVLTLPRALRIIPSKVSSSFPGTDFHRNSDISGITEGVQRGNRNKVIPSHSLRVDPHGYGWALPGDRVGLPDLGAGWQRHRRRCGRRYHPERGAAPVDQLWRRGPHHHP